MGDAGKWKLELMAKAREVYASDLTIEHFIMHCAFKSFEGKNTQVQAMMAEDINANDGSDAFALEKLATKYSQFVATLTSAKVTKIHAATKDDRHKCSYCDRRGHKASACRDRLRAEADNDTETNKDSEGDQLDDDIEKCTYCKQPGHRASRCRKKLKDTKAAEKKAAEEQGTAPAVANLTPATVNALMSQPLTSHQIQSICKELTTGGPKIFSVMNDLSHGIQGDEVKILIDVKGDDRKILNNTEGDLSHEIRRGEVKILHNIEGDLSHEIRRGKVKILIDVKGDDRETIDVKGDDREAIDVKGDDRKILNNIEGDLSHEIRRGEVKILIDVKGDDRETIDVKGDDREAIDVKGDDRKILNNIEGDLSHEIRRGKVKILNNMEGDLSYEIRDVSTAFLQSDLYPDCMIKHILETLDVEDDNLETLDVEDDNLKTLDTVKGDNIKTLVSI